MYIILILLTIKHYFGDRTAAGRDGEPSSLLEKMAEMFLEGVSVSVSGISS
jgi:hypothetical protein